MSTTAKPKSSAAKNSRRKLDPARPFDPNVIARARAVVASYQVIIWQEDDEYCGRGLELPLSMDDGRTADECVKHVREAMVSTVAAMLERGEAPPPPANEQRRTEQVNVRLTVEEKLLLDAAARRHGAAGLSDFVREAAVARATAGG